MGNCLNCGKPIPEKKEGQRGRQRKHCDDVCRATYSQKKAQKGVVVPRADIEAAIGKPVELKWDKGKLVFSPVTKDCFDGKLIKTNLDEPAQLQEPIVSGDKLSIQDLTQQQPKTNYVIKNTPKLTEIQVKAMCPKNLKGLAARTWIYDKKKELGLL